jgi:hypothetical protein
MGRKRLENSTADRSNRKLRICGYIEIPEVPQESPGLALELALGFDTTKPQTSAFFEHHPWVVVCIGMHPLRLSPMQDCAILLAALNSRIEHSHASRRRLCFRHGDDDV